MYMITFIDGSTKLMDTLTEADLKNADLSGVHLNGVDLSEADLRGACLRNANLSKADLSDADLRGADLRGVDLSDAIIDYTLFDKPVILCSLNKHSMAFNFNTNELLIGCMLHDFDYWLENIEIIGKEHGYEPEEIATYLQYITFIIKMHKDN